MLVDEQTALIGVGRQMLERALGKQVNVFRAGSFAANRDTSTFTILPVHSTRCHTRWPRTMLSQWWREARRSVAPVSRQKAKE